MAVDRTFRDYATRVSFNIALSRNQVGHLASIVREIECDGLGFDKRMAAAKQACAETGGNPSNFVVAYGALRRMGLIASDPRWIAENERLDEAEKSGARGFRQYWGPSHILTPAGQHIVELLRIAGLLAPAAANTNRKRKRRAA